MAITGVFNSQTAYQGSVPEAETVPKSTERAEISNETARASNMETPEMGNGPTLPGGNGEDDTSPKTGNDVLKKAVDAINKNAQNSQAVFGIHDATNRVTIKIVEKDTKKILKEYPPEKMLDMIAKVWELAGLMVDEKG